MCYRSKIYSDLTSCSFPIRWFVYTNVKLKMNPISLGFIWANSKKKKNNNPIQLLLTSWTMTVGCWFRLSAAFNYYYLLIRCVVSSGRKSAHKHALVFPNFSNFITNRWSIHRKITASFVESGLIIVLKYLMIKINPCKMNCSSVHTYDVTLSYASKFHYQREFRTVTP